MNIETENKLNRLLQNWKPGGLFFSSWLKENGYSDQLVQQYRRSGWFSSLAKGVLYRADDKLSAYGALSALKVQLNKNFYVGAHSALELFGFNHYIPMGKPILMIGHSKKDKVPKWFETANFGFEMKFFTTEAFTKEQLKKFHAENFEFLVSVPEQAFLECLLLAPKQYNYMDIYYILEQLTTLRPDVVQTLLEKTNHIKIKRLFLYMAEKAGHTWFSKLDKSKIQLGSGKRQLVEKGVYIPEYMITIPKELYEYE